MVYTIVVELHYYILVNWWYFSSKMWWYPRVDVYYAPRTRVAVCFDGGSCSPIYKKVLCWFIRSRSMLWCSNICLATGWCFVLIVWVKYVGLSLCNWVMTCLYFDHAELFSDIQRGVVSIYTVQMYVVCESATNVSLGSGVFLLKCGVVFTWVPIVAWYEICHIFWWLHIVLWYKYHLYHNAWGPNHYN